MMVGKVEMWVIRRANEFRILFPRWDKRRMEKSADHEGNENPLASSEFPATKRVRTAAKEREASSRGGVVYQARCSYLNEEKSGRGSLHKIRQYLEKH